MAINWIETEVIEHIKWTDSLASLKFKGAVLPYTSGQFTKVGLEIDGELVSRPYSYVSSPNDDFLEIVYVNVPDGKNLWMLATGTGLGVFISLLRTSDPWQRFENIVLVHGVRNSNELIYQDQINEFDKMNPGKFKYVQTVTREEKEGCLNMRIPAGLDSKMIQKSANLEINQDSQIMICGNPDMINDTVELLGKQGLERNRRSKPGNITLEKYW